MADKDPPSPMQKDVTIVRRSRVKPAMTTKGADNQGEGMTCFLKPA